MQDILDEFEDCEILQPISPISINGLSGHSAVYAGARNGYYEARFQLRGERQLAILVTSEGGSKIQEIIGSDAFNAIMSGIHAEEKIGWSARER